MPLLSLVGARLVAWDAREVLVTFNAVTPFLYLPAWAVAVAAGALRRWTLLAAASLVVAAHLTFTLPEVFHHAPVPAAARSAPTVRLFNANVFVDNDDVVGYAEEIRSVRPDIVVLQEATPAFFARLVETGALADLPHHRSTGGRADTSAAAIASRWPLYDDDVLSVGSAPILIRSTVAIAGREVRLFAFHAAAPFGGQRQTWIEHLDAVRQAVADERRPVLVAGDFNATWGHRAFRDLLEVGLTDAAAARGQPLEMTWPGNRRIPALARIDHILTTEDLAVTRIWTGRGRGSDHRPLIAEVAVLSSTS